MRMYGLSDKMATSQNLSLEGRGLKLDTAADIDAHVLPLISDPTRITLLNLSGNTIGVEAAERLAPLLSQLECLTVANLADIFTSRLLSEIPPALDLLLNALLSSKKLHTIDLSDNAFGLNTQAPLVKFLEKHTPLRHLILNNNGLGPEAGTLVADALTRLGEAQRGIPGKVGFLETIVCGRNRLENGSSPAWARALATHSSSLKEVRMSQNGIRAEGLIEIIKHGLQNAHTLRILELQDNLLTLSGAQALAKSIQGWNQLVELAIQDTLLRPQGGILLAEALAKGKNKKIEVLRLQYNEVDIKGVRGLLYALQNDSMPCLRRLELNGNKFTEEDPTIDELRNLLDLRKESVGSLEGPTEWGLDELDELEEESENEEPENDSIVSPKTDSANGFVESKLADSAEKQRVTLEEDPTIDKLAKKLGETTL